eukprot:Gb_04655 [translate_table: standard]
MAPKYDMGTKASANRDEYSYNILLLELIIIRKRQPHHMFVEGLKQQKWITQFKCRGFCMGLVISHSLMDEQAVSEILYNFASIARGEGLAIQPNCARSYLKARIPLQINYPHYEYTKLSDMKPTQPCPCGKTQSACRRSDQKSIESCEK